MKKYLFFILLNSIVFGCAHAKVPRKDTQMVAIQGGDFTALIEACGNQLIPGYTYCRKTEGSSTKENLFFVGPITNCKRDFCVEFKIYDSRGEVAYGGNLPKKSNRVAIPWSKLLSRDTFELADRGFWPFTYRVYWLDANGNENISVSEGEIRLRIIAKEYTPLHNVENDLNFVPEWGFWTKHGELVRTTTGMRTYVSRRIN